MALPKRHNDISLALQGGGAHGAFTWGVLDRLLQQPGLRIKAISGTSAGSMNALAVAQGLMSGGPEHARQLLTDFWETVAASAPFRLTSFASNGDVSMSPAVGFMMSLTQHFSPYQLNPLDINPLRQLVEKYFDFEQLRQSCPVELFIAATHANTGRLRLFRNHELSVEAVLASACLPTVHHTVEVDGEPYWDGGFSANPAIFPLYHHHQCADVLMILLAPMVHGKTPTTAAEIKTRAMDIAFNAGFLREMRVLAQERQMSRSFWRPYSKLEKRIQRLRFHMIDPDGALDNLPSATRMIPDQKLLHLLRDTGRQQAELWLQQHGSSVGRRCSINLAEVFI
ncbi:patatin-like phospholipase family protein [Oceanobacter mangrovi]|uniref:patatin-like phospholipase family protein n=1 Tax=Oceanobacter mangrovi TaxID=2862510 RepID=UPI001C8E36F2|nr:patatin-like phospholipase family protein [Oceanobacter mangrovi]